MNADPKQQISYVDTALGYACRADDSLNMGICYTEMSNALFTVDNFRAALEMNLKARKCFLNLKIPFYVAATWNTEGVSYAEMGKYRLAQGDVVGARAKLIPARDILFVEGKRRNSQLPYSEIYSWLGQLYLAEGNLPEAYEASLRSYELSDSLGQASIRLEALENLLSIILTDNPEGLRLLRYLWGCKRGCM